MLFQLKKGTSTADMLSSVREMPKSAGRPPSYGHILTQFTRRAVATQTRGTFLGMLWWLLDPLIMLSMYSVIFGLLMQGGSSATRALGPIGYPLSIFIGLTLLAVVTETMAQSPMAIITQSSIVKKIVFPLSILPLAELGPTALRFGLNLCLIALGALFFGPGFHWQWLILPLVFLPLFLLAAGLGWFLASTGVYFRDSRNIMRFASAMLFYCSAVFYDEELLHQAPWLWNILRFNPVLQAIDETRKIILFHEPVNWGVIAALNLVGLAGIFVGLQVFQKLRRGFADVL